MRRLWLFSVLLLIFYLPLFAQDKAKCQIIVDEIDRFDSTRLIAAKPVNIGYQIPSQFLLDNGSNKMIEQGKAMFSYTENDTINCFFLTLAMAEHTYYSIESGYNVLLLLSDQRVVGLLNVPDKGEFDKSVNMRIYQHTCVVPLDLFYALSTYKVEQIRIEYKGYKKTLEVLPEQQEAIRQAVRCVGEATGLYPIKP
ncbi:MAG: hypothetical protein ACK4TA_16060 [Saprospiraceae bacterium]